MLGPLKLGGYLAQWAHYVCPLGPRVRQNVDFALQGIFDWMWPALST